VGVVSSSVSPVFLPKWAAKFCETKAAGWRRSKKSRAASSRGRSVISKQGGADARALRIERFQDDLPALVLVADHAEAMGAAAAGEVDAGNGFDLRGHGLGERLNVDGDHAAVGAHPEIGAQRPRGPAQHRRFEALPDRRQDDESMSPIIRLRTLRPVRAGWRSRFSHARPMIDSRPDPLRTASRRGDRR
jgi:hypothetical protein